MSSPTRSVGPLDVAAATFPARDEHFRVIRPRWLTAYPFAVLILDILAMGFAMDIALRARFGGPSTTLDGTSYALVAFGLIVVWVMLVGLSRGYEATALGTGPDEYKRVLDACIRMTALVAVISYAFKIELARGFVAVALPLGTVLLVFVRFGARQVIRRGRARGRWSHAVVVVGSRDSAEHLIRQLHRETNAGLRVVGACLPSGSHAELPDGVPVVGSLTSVLGALQSTGADTVAVTASRGITSEVLRQLAWSLEGTGVDLIVAPALTNVAGPRITMRPVAGLPLLHVDEPEFTGVRRVVKATIDGTSALLALVLLGPLMLGIALLVRTTSPGPALFRQTRVGRDGQLFQVYKFRSMALDAEQRLVDLHAQNEHDPTGLLFKMRDDPRVTRIGRVLRRFSLDELPQLLNVVKGEMSLVGPRPPLPAEVDRYEHDVRRRLLVKPGITGLWQVNGRSDLSWEDSVRLDLYYVENWSLALDISILWKTLFAVFRRHGAY